MAVRRRLGDRAVAAAGGTCAGWAAGDMRMTVRATAAWAAAIWACALGAAAQGTSFSTAEGTAYARAKADCTRQGKRIKLMTDQTNDATLASGGIRVRMVCVAGPAKAAARGRRAAR